MSEKLINNINTNFVMVNNDWELCDLVKNQITYIKDFRDSADPYEEIFNESCRERVLRERATNIASCIGQISYGVFLPSYYQELLEIKRNNPKTENHQALLIGAMSIETITEFISTVQSVFPTAKCSSIDLDNRLTHLTKEVPSFQIMDGLNTSFPDNKFSSIHTNFLLNELIDNDKKSNESNSKLLEKIMRILKPGGKIIMVENYLKEYGLSPDNLFNLLTQEGFTKISISPGKRFKYPLDLDRFMRSSGGNHQLMENVDLREDDRVLLITAIK